MTEAGVYLTPAYGATEFGAVSRFFRKEGDEKDWEWMWFSDITNIRWDPQGDGTYEIQFLVGFFMTLCSITSTEIFILDQRKTPSVC